MGRLLWYAGVSTALAGGVVVSAFNQRANFYSACVYLAQSNLCLMILINLILFIYGSFMYGLQRLCYGSLRPIEIEQLYEKAWFAITETCLAMTIFREEVGAWFLVMFVALLTGKVWGWIGDGRVEILEQQPPANPRLFHIRLSVSLAMSVIYDLSLMNYTISTVIQQARPNMMVMFLFEFAILTTSSSATALRYCIFLVEAKVVKKQTQERLTERRREVREERAELIRQREAAAATAEEGSDAAPSNVPLPSEEDVDEMDIEVPGWEAKGHWVLMLDLVKDLVKLAIYVSFFVILLMFYGLPIHIMRDLFLTARSFAKRLAAFLRYRRATHNMNAKYEDATVEDIQREDTCIICREEMRPWSVTNAQAPPAAPGAPPAARPSNINERSRPKKLPCGHILHLGCLKSWLERQQVCPTCRRPVVDGPQGRNPPGAANNANPAGQGPQPQIPGQPDVQGAQPPAGRPPNRGMRMLNFGPLRVGFGQANLQDLAQNFGGAQPGQENDAAGGARIYGLELGFPRRNQPQPQATATVTTAGTHNLQEHLQTIEQQIVAEIRSLQTTQQELQLVQLLQAELARLRLMQNGGSDPLAAANHFQMPPLPQIQPGRVTMPSPVTIPQMQRHGVRPNTTSIPAGSADLPAGVTIPEGWSLLPLQRLDGPPVAPQTAIGTGPAANTTTAIPHGGLAPTATTTPQTFLSPIAAVAGTGSNNTTTTATPTPTINPEGRSQASSVDSSDTNAIHTPPSATADQSNSAAPNTTLPLQSTTNTTATSSSVPKQEEDSLPNWGNSQLFPASSRAAASTSHNTSEAPPQSSSVEEAPSSTHAGPSTVADESTPAPTPGEEEERRRGKGKARAVTVEDTVDEADGA
ncbi:related to E3 ubiquitin-protein ligase hrd-1 precursor [Phialocephala subalpina]|uniref:RING-type E3 ubiquitin transferase n=1 Tax=Phialocephala subalpina TaxID=576137 RepID=A0A1L7WNJ5_9HELO|nr:related to E3 ubiquitin-protein ligase hrd-1 precursor [Phialocephala subalpina]